MNDSEKAVRQLTNEERIAKVQSEKRKTTFQLAMLSLIGVLAFLLIWQLAVASGFLPSRYVPMPSKVVEMDRPESGRSGFGSPYCIEPSGGAVRLFPGDRHRCAARPDDGLV